MTKKAVEVKPFDPALYSSCCQKLLISSPLLLLQRDGSTLELARVRYCIGHNDCRKPHAVVAKTRNWPQSLSISDVLRLCDHSGPEYWLESAFHIFQWQGSWQALRPYFSKGNPAPWMSSATEDLIPAAQGVLASMLRVKVGGAKMAVLPGFGPASDEAREGTGEKIDRQSMAAGEDVKVFECPISDELPPVLQDGECEVEL